MKLGLCAKDSLGYWEGIHSLGVRIFRCEKCLNEYTKEFDACPMCGEKILPYEKLIDRVTANEIETAKQESMSIIKHELTTAYKL